MEGRSVEGERRLLGSYCGGTCRLGDGRRVEILMYDTRERDEEW